MKELFITFSSSNLIFLNKTSIKQAISLSCFDFKIDESKQEFQKLVCCISYDKKLDYIILLNILLIYYRVLLITLSPIYN